MTPGTHDEEEGDDDRDRDRAEHDDAEGVMSVHSRRNWPASVHRRGRVTYDGRSRSGAQRFEADQLHDLEVVVHADLLFANLTREGEEGNLGRLVVTRRDRPLETPRDRARYATLERAEIPREEFAKAMQAAGLAVVLDPAGYLHVVWSRKPRPMFFPDDPATTSSEEGA